MLLRICLAGLVAVTGLAAGTGRAGAAEGTGAGGATASLIRPGEEKHFVSMEQLTREGENAEAYFSWDGKALVLQSTPREAGCDQIFLIDLDTHARKLVSTGKGRCTCSFFLPGDQQIIYSSTHLASPECPPPPDRSHGYTWAVYDGYDVFRVPRLGGEPVRITDTPGYDAESTVSADGRIVFTSMRNGDLDIYTMDSDGKNVKQLTHELGYDGGPVWSPDGKRICYRAYHPRTPEETTEYEGLLKARLVRPTRMDLWIMDADGSNKVQLTDFGGASFCPAFDPSGKRVIFSSNRGDPNGRIFDLYLIGVDGKGLEQVTFEKSFDGFPMFSPDGQRLVFCSNRENERPHETNVFLARWKD